MAHISSWTLLKFFGFSLPPRVPPKNLLNDAANFRNYARPRWLSFRVGERPVGYNLRVDVVVVSWEPPKNHRPFFQGRMGRRITVTLTNGRVEINTSGKKVPWKKSPWNVDSMDFSRVKRMKHKLFVQQKSAWFSFSTSLVDLVVWETTQKTMVK